ncbi:MAG: DMT family transporter [Acidimicrobiales bacterium]
MHGGEPLEHDTHLLGVAAAAVAVSAWGLSGVIAKDIDMGGVALGAYRFTMYGLIVGVFVTLRGKPITIRVMRESMWGGLALGADIAFFFSAIKVTTIANATVIGALQPVLIAIVAWRVFGERVERRDIALAAVALVGVSFVVFGASGSPAWSLDGDLLAVGALFSWSAYFIFARRAKSRISSNEYTIGAALWAGVSNIALAPIFGQSLAWPSLESWIGLIVLAFGAGVLGHTLMNWSIQQIPLWVSSTFTLLIPVVSSSAAWIFLDEALTAVQVCAMAVVLGALAGIVGRQSGVGSKPRPLRR